MAPLIRADVNAANWAEALHNVAAAAAIARVCWGPISSIQRRGIVFVLSVCWERQPDPRGKAWGWKVTAEATAHEAGGCIPSFGI